MSRQWILRAVVGLIGAAIAAGVCLFGDWLPLKLGYCLNITPSEPVGIYRLVPGGAERGTLVLLKQPHDPAASVLHPYVPVNLPLIKRVAAIRGDVVRVGAHGVHVNGIPWPDSVPLTHDQEGRSLRPYPFGVYRVPADKLWVMSNHPRGLDSRYFGPVPTTSVISLLTPLATWSNPFPAQMLALAYALGLAALGILAAARIMNSLSDSNEEVFMKLRKVEKQLPSAQVNVTLPGKLKAELDNYATYYQQVHGEPIGIRKLLVEMARSFVETDREFQLWLKRNFNAVADTNSGPAHPSAR